MYVHVHMRVRRHVLVCLYGHIPASEVDIRYFAQSLHITFLRQGFSLKLKLAVSVSMAGQQQVTRILLSLPPSTGVTVVCCRHSWLLHGALFSFLLL